MKAFLRFTIATAFLLMTEFGCFAQHYKQTNLVSSTSGAAAVADPQLINPGVCPAAPAAPGGFQTTRQASVRYTTEPERNSL